MSVRELIALNPLGGAKLSAGFRDSLVHDLGRLEDLRKIFAQETLAIQQAAAAGLGQAAAICLGKNPTVTREMQRMVAELNNRELAAAFQSSSGQLLASPLPALSAQCYQGTPPVPEAEARRLMADPGLLLSENPTGGSALSSIVRNLAISDPAYVGTIVSVVAKASPLQKSAIAAGLGQAVMSCEVRAPGVALAIQRFVAVNPDQQFQATFQAVSGNTATAALGSTGPIGSGSVSGGGGPLGNTAIVSLGLLASGSAGQPGVSQRTSVFQFSVDSSTSTTNTRRSSVNRVFVSVSP